MDWAVTLTTCEPVLLAFEIPGPETVQLFTSEEVQEIVELPPVETRVGFALIETCGLSTVTVAFAGAEVPPAPVQVTWYVAVAAGLTEARPEEAPPVGNPPADEQDVALVEFQVSVVDWPASTVLGLAESEAVGAKALQPGGLTVPFLQESPPVGFEELPPDPMQPPRLQEMQELV